MEPFAPEQAEAFATICVASLSADGDFDDTYRARLYDGLRRFPGTAELDTPQHTELLRSGLRSLHRHGAGKALRRAAGLLSGEQREESFAWACEMAVASGKASGETSDIVRRIRSTLGISDTVLCAVRHSASLRYGEDIAAPVFADARLDIESASDAGHRGRKAP